MPVANGVGVADEAGIEVAVGVTPGTVAVADGAGVGVLEAATTVPCTDRLLPAPPVKFTEPVFEPVLEVSRLMVNVWLSPGASVYGEPEEILSEPLAVAEPLMVAFPVLRTVKLPVPLPNCVTVPTSSTAGETASTPAPEGVMLNTPP